MVVEVLVLGWWEVCAPGVQALLVVPVDPFEGGVLDVVEAAPGTAAADELGLVEAVEGLGCCGVVEGVGFGAGRGDRAGGGEPFGLADPEVLTGLNQWTQHRPVGGGTVHLTVFPARAAGRVQQERRRNGTNTGRRERQEEQALG